MKNKLGASASPVPTPGSRSRGPLGFELQCRRAAPGGAARARTAPAASPSPIATAGSARAATGPARGAPRTANAGHRWEHSCWKPAFQSSGHLPQDRTIWVLWQIHAYYEENKLFLVLQTILPMLSDYSHFRSPSHFKCTPLPRFTFRPSSPLLAPSPEGRREAELIPHPSRWQPRGWNAAGPGGQAAGRWWCCPRNGRRWCWPREWEAAPGMRPPQHLPRAQVSAPRPNPRCRVPGNCSGRRDRWKTKWGAHPSFKCRSSSSDVTDFGGWESRRTPGVSGLFCPLHTPGDTQEREREELCVHWSHSQGRQGRGKSSRQTRRKIQQVTSSGCIWKHACKGRTGNTLLIFCLFFTFTPGPPAQEEHIQMCDVRFFLNKSSASCIKSPRKMTTKQTQHLDHCTISPGELPSSPLSQHSQLTGLLPEQPGTQGNICRTEQEFWALYCAIDLVFYKHIHLHCTGEEKAMPGHKNKTHAAENL